MCTDCGLDKLRPSQIICEKFYWTHCNLWQYVLIDSLNFISVSELCVTCGIRTNIVHSVQIVLDNIAYNAI